MVNSVPFNYHKRRAERVVRETFVANAVMMLPR